ncbi:MAG: hypothetical protein R3D29_08645 [Nitratireductor sp.]
MEKATTRSSRKLFESPTGLFDNISGEVARQFASMGSDITLILNSDGTVRDIAFVDGTLEQYGLRSWVGRDWRDTVTSECVEKIGALMDECAKGSTSHSHQVNHPGNRIANLQDLPVEYVLTRIDGFPHCVAFGKDLRKFAEIQQQLIHAQFETGTRLSPDSGNRDALSSDFPENRERDARGIRRIAQDHRQQCSSSFVFWCAIGQTCR